MSRPPPDSGCRSGYLAEAGCPSILLMVPPPSARIETRATVGDFGGEPFPARTEPPNVASTSAWFQFGEFAPAASVSAKLHRRGDDRRVNVRVWPESRFAPS